VTTAPDLARFVAAALAGWRGEPSGRGVLSPAWVRLGLNQTAVSRIWRAFGSSRI
jgi:hypothetical protein